MLHFHRHTQRRRATEQEKKSNSSIAVVSKGKAPWVGGFGWQRGVSDPGRRRRRRRRTRKPKPVAGFSCGANIRLAAALTHQRSLIWRTQSSLNYREIRAGLGRRWESGLGSSYYIQQRRQWLAPVAAQPRARGHVTISWTGSALCVFLFFSNFCFLFLKTKM